MRILVTNDDGVHAPGLAAITRALAGWAIEGEGGVVADGGNDGVGVDRQVVVVAPLANHSGAGAAVGTVYERETIAFRKLTIEGAESVPTYGLDASPALTVIVGALGAFGPRPDLIVSGINLGVNVGRSILHSGTVGAVLTGSQLGISGLAISMRSNTAVDHWETVADLAVSLLPAMAAAAPRTVLNLNVPSVPPGELRGVRRGRISGAGIIKAAADLVRQGSEADGHRGAAGRAASGAETGAEGGSADEGEIRLTLGTAIPSLGAVGGGAPVDDVSLLAQGFATITPLVGVREDSRDEANALVDGILSRLESRTGG